MPFKRSFRSGFHRLAAYPICPIVSLGMMPSIGRLIKSSTFCQHGIDPQLDSDRFIVNNTHELIVLPVIWQVLPAICFGLRQSTISATVR